MAEDLALGEWDPSKDVIDGRLCTAQVVPKAGEDGDVNRPRNLHNALELFLKTGRGCAAKCLQHCAVTFFDLVERRPEKSEVRLGEARICWECGYCGLACELTEDDKTAPKTAAEAALRAIVCSCCGGSQTNFAQVHLSDGVVIPWMEVIGAQLKSALPAGSRAVKDISSGYPAATQSEQTAAAVTPTESTSEKEAKRAEKRAAVEAAVKAAREKQSSSEKAAREKQSSSDKAVAEDAPTIEDLDERLVSFLVQAKDGEAAHPNFPRNLHNAMELFMRVGATKNAKQLQACTSAFFRLLEEGPKQGDVSGRGMVCFDCGHLGLQPSSKESPTSEGLECRACGDSSQTFFVDLILPGGRQLPWMERGTVRMPSA